MTPIEWFVGSTCPASSCYQNVVLNASVISDYDGSGSTEDINEVGTGTAAPNGLYTPYYLRTTVGADTCAGSVPLSGTEYIVSASASQYGYVYDVSPDLVYMKIPFLQVDCGCSYNVTDVSLTMLPGSIILLPYNDNASSATVSISSNPLSLLYNMSEIAVVTDQATLSIAVDSGASQLTTDKNATLDIGRLRLTLGATRASISSINNALSLSWVT